MASAGGVVLEVTAAAADPETDTFPQLFGEEGAFVKADWADAVARDDEFGDTDVAGAG